METLRDEKGRTLYSHTSGEVVEIHKCKKILVKPRMNDEKCCEELTVWSGRNYEKPTYMKAVSREVSSVCTLGRSETEKSCLNILLEPFLCNMYLTLHEKSISQLLRPPVFF